MKTEKLSRKRRSIAIITLLITGLCITCASNSGVRTGEDKNITDYFNILSGQKIVQGKINREKGEYRIRMEGCYELISAKIDVKNEMIRYAYTNPCAGPPPECHVAVWLAVSGDAARFLQVWNMERTWNQVSTDYFRLIGGEFTRIEKKDLPADVAVKFNRFGR